MEIEKKTTKYTFENKISYSQRSELIDLYIKGASVSALGRCFRIDNTSVYYHLKKAGVFVKGRGYTINVRGLAEMRGTAAYGMTSQGVKKFMSRTGVHPNEYWPPHEREFPLNYKEYLKRDRAIQRRKQMEREANGNSIQTDNLLS